MLKIVKRFITTSMCFWLLTTELPINVIYAQESETPTDTDSEIINNGETEGTDNLGTDVLPVDNTSEGNDNNNSQLNDEQNENEPSEDDLGTDLLPSETNTYTVTFYVDGREYDKVEANEENNHVVSINQPEKLHYTFDGWYPENTYTGDKVNLNDISSDTSLFGRFNLDSGYDYVSLDGKDYFDVNEALRDATNGRTVKLKKKIEVDTLTIPVGSKLDLNGFGIKVNNIVNNGVIYIYDAQTALYLIKNDIHGEMITKANISINAVEAGAVKQEEVIELIGNEKELTPEQIAEYINVCSFPEGTSISISEPEEGIEGGTTATIKVPNEKVLVNNYGVAPKKIINVTGNVVLGNELLSANIYRGTQRDTTLYVDGNATLNNNLIVGADSTDENIDYDKWADINAKANFIIDGNLNLNNNKIALTKYGVVKSKNQISLDAFVSLNDEYIVHESEKGQYHIYQLKEKYVAQIGEQGYESLQAALQAATTATNKVVTLVAPVEIASTDTVTIPTGVTLTFTDATTVLTNKGTLNVSGIIQLIGENTQCLVNVGTSNTTSLPAMSGPFG